MSGCAICAELEAMPPRERNIKNDRVSHCRECHGSWSRRGSQQHCTRCHRTYSSPSAADVGHTSKRDAAVELRRVCKDPAEAGLVPELNPWGTEVWHRPGTPPPR